MAAVGQYLFIFISVYSIVVELEAVTVSPALCPTNKIAPHRRQASWDHTRPRTLGLIYGLLGPDKPYRPQYQDPVNDLQEQPQEDDQDDCGEIEDYDETDLSSLTANNGPRRKIDNTYDRHFFGNNHVPSYNPGQNRPPSKPQRPQRPTRPPYPFEGIYGPNGYRPPTFQYPGHIKPVQEDTVDRPQADYRPGLIGGFLGHIVGFPSMPVQDPPQNEEMGDSPFRFPQNHPHGNRRPKKSQQTNKSTSIIGSFVDLLFNK